MPTNQRLTLRLLDKYFASVKDLRSYLSELLDPAVAFLPREHDPMAYTNLIETSLIGLKCTRNSSRSLAFAPPMSDMLEVIERAQEKLIKLNKSGNNNVITLGYIINNRKHQRNTLKNFHVNTNVTALQSPEWELLLQRIGTDAMMHLLTETSLFITLPNDCLCQLIGELLLYVHLDNLQLFTADPPPQQATKRKLPFTDDERRPRKRLKHSTDSSANLNTHEIPPAKLLLVRGRLFYARPVVERNSNRIAAGLPPQHILQRLNPNQTPRSAPPEPYVDPDPRKQMDDARHLAKYVFPRQYGLPSVFLFYTSNKGAIQTPDFSDREQQLKGSFKTPKRLKDVIPMLEKLIWRHGKCGYKPLRDHACPSKVKTLQRDRVDSSGILELISEHTSSAPRTQPYASEISVDSEGNSVLPIGLTQAALHAKTKPRFVEYSCSYIEVFRYAVLVSKAVIPKAFWGSESNFKQVLTHVKSFIAGRRYESLSMHNIVQGFSTSACEWLMPPGKGQQQTRVSVSDALKRRELLEDFLFWYFDFFLLPLLKTTFYVTESSAFRNHVLYFRQDDWEFLCAPLVERLTGATFEKMSEAEATQVLRHRKLGFSFIRLLPKENGVRPIANLRRKNSAEKGKSINQILQTAFKILTYERDTRPHLIGASVFSTNEFYARLKQFKARLPPDDLGNLPKLYFVKVDVQACFDTIDQTKLLEILRELISEDMYLIQRYGRIASEAGNVKRTYVQKAIPDNEYPHFLKVASDLANVLHHTIFVDQVKYSRSAKDEILQLLEEHITENIVKIGHHYYRQTIGIPQGSILSSILCSFFYGDLEKRFGNFMKDPQSALFRQTDDYLFITTHLSKAKEFLAMMNQGHPEYGCFISKDKTLTNFDYDEELNCIPSQQRNFPWCGYMINVQNLSVSVEYSRYHGSDLSNTLTVARGRRPGAAFRHKMLQLAKARSHIIFTDTDLNTPHTVHLNIYQNFLLSALKMHSYIRDWGLDTHKYAIFLRDTVEQMISYAAAAIRNKASSKFSKMHGGVSNIRKSTVSWLGMHAFHSVLSQKPARYPALLKFLRLNLARSHNRIYARRFRALVKEGLAELTPIGNRLE